MTTPNEVPERLAEKLAYTAAEVKKLLNVGSTTLWRLKKDGVLMPVHGIRHLIYSRKAIDTFLSREASARARN